MTVSTPDSSMRVDNFLVKDPNNPDSSPFGMQVYPQIDCAMKAVLLGFMVDVVRKLLQPAATDSGIN